jgi:hydroxyacylglutathione hydrolase
MQSSQTVIPVDLGFVRAFLVKGEKTLLVDTGVKGSGEKILEAMKQNEINPQDISLIVITHAHADHFGSLRALKNELDAPVAVQESEAGFLKAGNSAPVVIHGLLYRLLSKFFSPSKIGQVTPEVTFGEKLDLSPYGVDGYLLHTPGHTQGSASVVLTGGEVIIGDTIGGKADGSRAALPAIYADLHALKKSLGAVLALQPAKIYTAHGGAYDGQTAAKLL